jgi:putative ABC transport system permease protein
VSGIRATIVGVTPRDFAGVRQEVPDVWITLSALGDIHQRAIRDSSACCEMVARLAEGRTVRGAQAELANLAAIRRRDLPPSDRQMTVTASPAVAFGRLGEQVRPLFAALQVAMFLVLFIACANVASLMLGRAAARDRETAVRLAIGAGRARLVRQLITEGVVVAIIAGFLAAVLTAYALSTGTTLLSAFLSREGGGSLSLRVTTDSRVAIYVAGISIAAGIMFALAPALQASRADLASVLRTAGGAGAARGTGRLRSLLIAGQIALSVALLIVASGLARSAIHLVRSDPGFHAENVLSVWLTNPQELALPPERAREIEDEVRRRLAALPGVQSLAVASRIPLGGNVTTSAMLPEERATQAATADGAPQYPYSFVSASFFSTLGIPLMRGRPFTEQDVRDSAPVAVISDSMARALWPRGDGLGKRLALHVTSTRGFNAGRALVGTAEVIGVVGTVRGVSMTGGDVGDVYLPRLTNDWSSRILLRTQVDPASIAGEVTRIVHEVEPALPVSTETMVDVVASDGSVTTARASAGILAAVGVIGLLLASVAVYGMVSYAVRQKQREIGIRMALGAHGAQVLAAALRGTLMWIVRGVVAGVVFGIIGIKLTNAVLTGASVSASVIDPASIVLVPFLIGIIAVLAASLSARKAAATNPAVVLRADG